MNATAPPSGLPASPADFEAGVLEFAGRLRAFIRKRVSDPNDAEDIAQDVFLKVFRARGTLRDARKQEAWLYQTARGAIIDYYRRRRPSEEIPASLAAEVHEFDEVGERLRRSVRRFLATLPPHYRKPLELAEFQGKPVADIARELSLSDTAVKSRLTRGRAMLREKLLRCCQFEFDRFGKVIDLRQKGDCACTTDCDPAEAARGRTGIAPAVPVDITLAAEADEPAMRDLIDASGLAATDLTPAHFVNFLKAKSGGRMVGCVGLEIFGDIGLLRSLAVAPDLRGRGVGARLVAEAERVAAQLSVRELYLLTTTAEKFFAEHGYIPVPRAQAPAAIQGTAEFGTLCPTSSAFMHKSVKVPQPAGACC